MKSIDRRCRQCITLFLLGTSVLSGCTKLGMRDVQLDYLSAQDTASLQYQTGQSPVPTQSVFTIPPLQMVDSSTVPILTNDKRSRFNLPAPQALSVLPAAGQRQAISLGKPATPIMIRDGNGMPGLKIDGDPELVKEYLMKALASAQLKPLDKELSIGKIFITYQNQSYFLRLAQNQLTTVLTVQEDQQTLASENIAKGIFQTTMAQWPQ